MVLYGYSFCHITVYNVLLAYFCIIKHIFRNILLFEINCLAVYNFSIVKCDYYVMVNEYNVSLTGRPSSY